jgi:hypothetical protein
MRRLPVRLVLRLLSRPSSHHHKSCLPPQFPVPDAVPDETAAQFFINPVAVYGMLHVLQVLTQQPEAVRETQLVAVRIHVLAGLCIHTARCAHLTASSAAGVEFCFWLV